MTNVANIEKELYMAVEIIPLTQSIQDDGGREERKKGGSGKM